MPFSTWNNAQKAAVWRFGPVYFQRALVWWSAFHCSFSNFSKKLLIDHSNPIVFEVSRLASFDQATFKWLRFDVFGSSYVQSATAWQFKPYHFQRVAAWGLEANIVKGVEFDDLNQHNIFKGLQLIGLDQMIFKGPKRSVVVRNAFFEGLQIDGLRKVIFKGFNFFLAVWAKLSAKGLRLHPRLLKCWQWHCVLPGPGIKSSEVDFEVCLPPAA